MKKTREKTILGGVGYVKERFVEERKNSGTRSRGLKGGPEWLGGNPRGGREMGTLRWLDEKGKQNGNSVLRGECAKTQYREKTGN